VVEQGEVAHRGATIASAPALSRNGKHSPPRPRIEVAQTGASPEEAAAIAAAIEQFLRDTAPVPSAEPEPAGGWLRAAMREVVGADPDELFPSAAP
jgi:hypothetical protein